MLGFTLKAITTAVSKLPIFKSNVVEAVNKIPNTGSGNQVLGQIKNIPGVKQSEIKWIGLDDFLQNKKSVTKKEVSCPTWHFISDTGQYSVLGDDTKKIEHEEN